jgi:hypothetical protein
MDSFGGVEMSITESQRGKAASKSKKRLHRRDTEFAEFGVISKKNLYSALSAPPR